MPGTTANEFSLTATTHEEPKAREALERLLTGRSAVLRERVTLLIAELLAGSASRDAASDEVTITLASEPTALRVEVRDRGNGTVLRSLRRPPSTSSGRGWSPHLLSRVADRWGLVSDEGGTWVWLEFELPAERSG